MEKGIVLRIYPNKVQKDKINKNFGCVRFLWNQFLTMTMRRYANNKKSLTLSQFDYNILIPALKEEYPFLKEADSTSLQSVSKDFIFAYNKFFSKDGGYPKLKSKKNNRDSYRSQRTGKTIEIIDNNRIKVPKLGKVR